MSITMSRVMNRLKSIVLFLLSPFIALGYMMTFPMVALPMLLAHIKGESEKSTRVG